MATEARAKLPLGLRAQKQLGDPIGGGIVTYEIGGVQYVAVAGGMKNTVTQQTESGPAWVAILSVPKK